MHEESLFVSKIPQLPHEAWTRQGGCLSEGKLVTGQVLGTVELKRGLLLLKQLVWIPVCQVSHTNQVRLKPPTQKSGRARLKKPFYRETWADFHDMKSFQTGIMIFTWTQWHVFCSGIFILWSQVRNPIFCDHALKVETMGTCLFGRRTEVARVCQANRKIPKHYLKRCEHATEKGYAKVSLDALGAFSLITSYRCLLTSPTWFFSLLLQLKPLSFQVWRFLGFIWHSLEIPHTIASESLMSFQHQVPEKYMGDMSHTTRHQSSQSGFCRRCRFAMIAEMGIPNNFTP